MKISAINFNNVKQCQKNLENQKANTNVNNSINRENYVSLWNKGGYRMSFGSTLNLSNDFNKWIKENDIEKKTLDAYAFCLNNIKKNSPERYEEIKDLKPYRSTTSFNILNQGPGNEYYVSRELTLADRNNQDAGYYTAIFDLKGEITDDIYKTY